MITQWVGEAYNSLLDAKYDKFRRQLFEKTGCLLTADSSGDSMVRPEGLPDYKVPPLSMMEPMQQLAISSVPEGEIQDEVDEGYRHIESDDEEMDMVVVEDQMEVDDGNIFDILFQD